MAIQEWLKTSRAFEVWRQARQFQQLGTFHQLLQKTLEAGKTLEPYSETRVSSRLLAQSKYRRPFMKKEDVPHILGFGTNEWEERGLWPAFQGLSKFRLFNYAQKRETEETSKMQERLAKDFLVFLEEEERQKKVDCVFFYASGVHISNALLDALHQKGIWTLVMGLDDKHQLSHPTDEKGLAHQLRVAAACDLYWTTWRAGETLIRQSGGNAWYAPEAADPAFHRPLNLPRDLDLVFIGQAYGSRVQLVRELRKKGLSVTTRGRGWPEGSATFEETIQLFSRAQLVLGMGGVGYMDGVKHLKGRDFEVPMCGAAYLTSFNPDLTDYFHIGKEILCYSSHEECAEMASWFLRQKTLLDEVRAQALKRSLKDHTWHLRLKQLLQLWRTEM